MESKALAKQIKIKTGGLNRYIKDYNSYNKEKDTQTARVEALKAENADEGKIRQNEEALAETIQMLPGCKAKVQT